MVATANPLTKRRKLLLAARQLAAIQYDYTEPEILTVKDPSTGALVLPDNGFPLGLHAKSSGGRLNNGQTINDIRSHGVGGPTRQIPTERNVTAGLDAQETHRRNLQNYWGGDFSNVVPDAAGGIHLDVPDLPLNLLSRVVLYGRDDFQGLPIHMAWIGNCVNISETSEQQMQDAELAMYPYVMNFMTDEGAYGPISIEIFGEGWDLINQMSDTGFQPPVEGIDVTPDTKTLTVSAGANHTQQLVVEDSNGVVRTSQATYSTSDGTKVTVSSTGLMTGVATGSATVTATYNGFTDTCVVTVNA